MKSILFVGMDVHKNSYSLCCYDKESGEISREVRCTADAKLIKKYVLDIQKDMKDDMSIKCGYEAGCLGFSLYKSLKTIGIDCDILTPTTMHHSSKNKVVKTDKMDARNIAINLANGIYRPVHIPDDEDLKVKEYIRMTNNFKKELKKVKQQILAYVLRLGYNYEGKSKWTIGHIKWLRNLEMDLIEKEILSEYLAQYDLLVDKIERFTSRIDELSHTERYEEKISKLRCFKGVDTLSAMTIQVETSDFNRFPNAKAYASFTGLTCGEQSSGDKRNTTSITKQGNSTLRTTLVECAQAIVKGSIYAPKSKRLKARQKGQSVEVIAYADKAAERLKKRYDRLIRRSMPHNKAIVAVARELACFIWGMETGNIY